MTEAETPTPPGLFLILDASQPDNGLPELEAACANAPVEVILISHPAEAAAPEITKQLVTTIQNKNIAVLIEDNVTLAMELAADGVHLNNDSFEGFSDAVDQVGGDQMIIGTTAKASRDAAMILAEEGCTYMAITSQQDDHSQSDTEEEFRRPPTLEWWVTLFETPVVAWQLETLDDVRAATEAGADFIALAPALWQKAGETGQIMTTIVNTMDSAAPKTEDSTA